MWVLIADSHGAALINDWQCALSRWYVFPKTIRWRGNYSSCLSFLLTETTSIALFNYLWLGTKTGIKAIRNLLGSVVGSIVQTKVTALGRSAKQCGRSILCLVGKLRFQILIEFVLLLSEKAFSFLCACIRWLFSFCVCHGNCFSVSGKIVGDSLKLPFILFCSSTNRTLTFHTSSKLYYGLKMLTKFCQQEENSQLCLSHLCYVQEWVHVLCVLPFLTFSCVGLSDVVLHYEFRCVVPYSTRVLLIIVSADNKVLYKWNAFDVL